MATAPSSMTQTAQAEIVQLVAEIVAVYVGYNTVPAAKIPELIRTVYEALTGFDKPVPHLALVSTERQKPAVPISRSVQHDYIVCLEDGKHLTMLKRYLRTRYGLSPEEYRRKWGLPAEYPMAAPAYAARRSEFAKKIGLGKGVRRRD